MKKTIKDKGKAVSKYLGNYIKMTGLFPEFKDKNKKKEPE